MGEFHQNGVVTTLHNLRQRPLEAMEADLMRFQKSRPMGLVLPSLFSELEGPALSGIVEELTKVPYLSEIVIGLDRASEDQYRFAIDYFSGLPQHHKILWNDGPRLRAIDGQLKELGLAPTEEGKGRNVWYCYGYILASGKADAVALHDCDILTYDRSLLARLLYPVANPNFSYAFNKGFYSRVAGDRISGRVVRLFVTPLIRTLKRVCGCSEFLEYMDSFRYPLAGEFSMRAYVINDLRIPSDWGLEIGVLSEMKRNYATNRLCQSDIADVYDHKHQDLSVDDREKGLSRMSMDIAKAFFRKLATNGEVFTPEAFRTIKATYYRMALDMIQIYKSDAEMNGLKFDVHKEEEMVELFAQNIIESGKIYLESPTASPNMPTWRRIESAAPSILKDLNSSVLADLQD